MKDEMVQHIAADPSYVKLKAERNRLGWTLTGLMLLVYYGFMHQRPIEADERAFVLPLDTAASFDAQALAARWLSTALAPRRNGADDMAMT